MRSDGAFNKKKKKSSNCTLNIIIMVRFVALSLKKEE